METQTTSREGKLAWSIEELATALGVSKGFITLEIKRGNLKALKRSGRVLIMNQAVDAYLADDEAPAK